MKKKLVLLTLIMCLLVTGCFTGCGTKKTASNDEEVTLTWIFGGPGKLEDSERVWAEFNKELQKHIPNTTIEFEVISHDEYAEKWKLINAGQEDADIVWISWALNFADEVAKGSFMDITDLVNEYGQDMMAEFPDYLLDLTTINGRIYGIPCYQMMTAPLGVAVDASHVEKGWFNIEEIEGIFNAGRTITKEDYKVYEEYIKKVQESGEKVKYISSDFLSREIMQKIGLPYGGLESITCNAAIARLGDDYKVYNTLTDFPENYDYFDLVNEWYKKGYIRKDILENPTENRGDYLLQWTQCLKDVDNRLPLQYGNKPMKACKTHDLLYVGFNASSTNTGISSHSKNPERAMQVINLMNSSKGKDLLNLLSYGIEGEHYKKIDDEKIEWLGEATPGSSQNRYGYENWALGNALTSYITEGYPEGWNKYIDEEINKKAEISRLAGFSLDQTPIAKEIAQYQTVIQEFKYLEKGTTANYKELLEKRNAKLKKAGSDKIVAEVQKQLDAWVKANNK